MNPLDLVNAIKGQELLVLALYDLMATWPEVRGLAENEDRHLYWLRCEAKKLVRNDG